MKADPTSAPGSMFGSMPVLVKDGAVIAQSFAVAQLASDLGLQTARSPEMRALDTMACGALADMMKAMYKCLFGTEEEKKKGLERLPSQVTPILEGMERQYARGAGPFLSGAVISLGDLAIFNAVTSPFPGLLALAFDMGPFPKIRACVDACGHYLNQAPSGAPPPAIVPPASGTPQLIYFDAAGRAELSRLAFHAGGVPFTDTRIAGDWATIKADPDSAPGRLFGQLPVLDHGGFLVGQSLAVVQYAADLGINRTNPTLTPWQRALDTMLLGAHTDLCDLTLACVYGEEDSKAAARAKITERVTPLLMGIERQYARGTPPFLYSSEAVGPTLGDLAVFNVITLPRYGLGELGVSLDPYPLIRACVAACRAAPGRPGLAAYLESRGF
eukprot:NODE_7938_length_1535_cov_14.580256.p1 GENE.NODE_7938_length_1535_cov_14.580256~~NODE_7938_length_1535_cov_14.580256.p1  ORF type:complete len:387 (+),score=121.34 NODE_7938_length_1535_cov_14.580256:147-1307(+)